MPPLPAPALRQRGPPLAGNHFGSANCTRTSCGVVNLTEIGDAMVANGLRAVGYEYVNLGARAPLLPLLLPEQMRRAFLWRWLTPRCCAGQTTAG